MVSEDANQSRLLRARAEEFSPRSITEPPRVRNKRSQLGICLRDSTTSQYSSATKSRACRRQATVGAARQGGLSGSPRKRLRPGPRNAECIKGVWRMRLPLRRRRGVVTGASSGITKPSFPECDAEGVEVLAVDINHDGLSDLDKDGCETLEADITDPQARRLGGGRKLPCQLRRRHCYQANL